ncbi:MAG: phosphoenolpyruvate carboxylase, partial [Steroidobacteraceae bacterium]
DAAASSELEARVSNRPPALARDLERAFSTWFQAVNLAEQVHRIRRRRAYFLTDADRPQPGGVSDSIARLKAAGLSFDEVLQLLGQLTIEPVFISHPTESTRRTILRKQRRLAEMLFDRLQTLSPHEQRSSLGRLRTEFTTGWQTEDHPRQRLTVADEREYVMFFLAEVLYRVIPGFYEEIAEALEHHYGRATDVASLPTLVRFGSWVGGDLDGNPDITAKTLRETLARQQQAILNAYFLELQSLSQLLSQSASRIGVSAALQQRSEEYALLLPGAGASAPARHDRMPYREFLGQLAERIRATYDNRPTGYESAAHFQRDVDLVADSLLAHRGRHAGLFAVRRLQRRIATFGFHLARLDVRQHATVHHRVIAQGRDEPGWLSLDSATRRTELVQCLVGEIGPRTELDAASRRALAVFEAMLQCRRRFGSLAVGAYVVNGVNGADDVLAALLLAQWAEAYDKRSGTIAIDVAPMFDSQESLERAGTVMGELLSEPLYRRHLDSRGHRQSVLVSYSEANKQVGLCASRLAVHRAQEALAGSLVAAREQPLLTHVRGGSIPRGGGRIDDLLAAMPAATVRGELRITEQGEGIEHHYGLGPIALRTLERAFGALALATAGTRKGEKNVVQPQSIAIAERLAAVSAARYRGFVTDEPGFRSWFQSVTPIDVIERMQIGGRPILRPGFEGLAGLRAVPWVFAWTQNRILLPGWFGAGSALQAVIDEFGLVAVRTAARDWAFLRQLLDDVEIMLARTDLAIARHYATLAADSGTYFPNLEQEFALAVQSMLAVKESAALLDGDPTQQRALALRNPYVDPMNLMQVDLLRRWRAGGRTDRDLLEALLASVNGIAQGLQSTG